MINLKIEISLIRERRLQQTAELFLMLIARASGRRGAGLSANVAELLSFHL